jgi:hypothetical protein
MHPFTVAPRFHQTGPLQVSQMTGDFRLHHPQRIRQFADTGFARREQIQQPQSRRIGQGFEKECGLSISSCLHFCAR